jgi:lysophospholipase L1-like esterase
MLRLLPLTLLFAAFACVPEERDDRDDDEQEQLEPVIPLDEVHVLGFGDSVTVGYCASPGKSYVELLIENDDDDYPDYAGRDLSSIFGSVTDNNKAINGSTSCDYSEELIRGAVRQDQDTSKPTILLITLGGNDLIHDYSCANPRECHAYCADLADAEIYAANYKQRMIEFINAIDDEVEGPLFTFIGNIYDPTDGVGDIENASIPLPDWPDGIDVLALYNTTIAEIAAETGSHLVDVHGAMMGHGIHYNDQSHPNYSADDPSYWYCANLEDPNDKGYSAIRDAYWEKIETVLQL